MPSWGSLSYPPAAWELEERRKPPPVKIEWAGGSMEWFAEQEKARSTATSSAVPHSSPDMRDIE